MAEWLLNLGLYFWGLFKLWITTLFVMPFRNLDMLWILVPLWLGWFFAEFFQEKVGTSMGNAISNSVIVTWGSIDCTRKTVFLITSGVITSTLSIISRFALIFLIFSYGIVIVVLGLKGNMIIKYIGRIREVTYFFAMFVPVLYNATPLSWSHIIAAVLFFPLFYFAIELFDRYTPNPKAIIKDLEDGGGEKKESMESNSFSSSEKFNMSSSSAFGESSGNNDFGKNKGNDGLDDLGDFKI